MQDFDREAHRRYHEAFAALDRIVNETVTLAGSGRGADNLPERLATFQSLLVQFLQQITPYVDSKLRAIERTAADAALTATAAQRAAVAAQRAMQSSPEPQAPSPETRAPSPGRPTPTPEPRTPSPERPAPSPDAVTYVSFEDVFRGPESEIRARQAEYVPLFSGARDVLDVGCGRGEFLVLLGEAGVGARGIDANEEMVALCRARGLAAERADAVDYLCELPEGALGGLFCAQVVEHLPPDRLMAFLREASRALRPGARIVLETINPTCWVAFFEAFIRDLTHVKPLHPETLKFLAVANGFTGVRIQFRNPVAEAARLQQLQPSGDDGARLADLVSAFNLNMERLNDRLFTYLDYALIGTRV